MRDEKNVYLLQNLSLTTDILIITFQASSFLEQVAEDESQMECFSVSSTGVMVWYQYHTADSHPDSHNWFTSSILGSIIPFE